MHLTLCLRSQLASLAGDTTLTQWSRSV